MQALQLSGAAFSSDGGSSGSGRSDGPNQAPEPSPGGALQPEASGASFAALLRSVSLREHAPEQAFLDSSEIVGGPDARDGSGVRVRLKNYFSRQKQGE